MATYASRAWLGTTHENQILDLLRRELLLKGSRIEVPGMAFFATLRMHANVATLASMKGVGILLGLGGLGKHWCWVSVMDWEPWSI